MKDNVENGISGWHLIWLFAAAVVVQLGLAFIVTRWLPSWTERGQFGDMFGAANTLFSGLAFAGVVYTILLQRHENKMQMRQFLEANRPIITARIEGGGLDGDGIISSPLTLYVQNSGNRPAKNVRLSVDPDQLSNSWCAENRDNQLKGPVERCFDESSRIPILMNGEETSNGFGLWSRNLEESTFAREAVLQIEISYEDLYNNPYSESIELRLSDNRNFAGGGWSKPKTFTQVIDFRSVQQDKIQSDSCMPKGSRPVA
jgi:hypothetical protein